MAAKKRTLDDYDSQINSIVDSLLGSSFSYDHTADPVYQQYEAAYTKQGQRAAQDAYGQTAARTGGYGSSYAATAAAQAENYYMSELAAKIPELYDAAYEMYADDLSRQQSYANLLSSLGKEYYDRALQKAQTLAKKKDYSGYKALGYTDAEIQKLKKR